MYFNLYKVTIQLATRSCIKYQLQVCIVTVEIICVAYKFTYEMYFSSTTIKLCAMKSVSMLLYIHSKDQVHSCLHVELKVIA